MIQDDFSDFGNDNGSTTQAEYTYDANGNTLTDANKGISYTYNFLNLPIKAVMGKSPNTGARLEWLYDVNGGKTAKLVYSTAGALTTRKDYLFGFEYTNGALEAYYFDEGRIAKVGAAYRYEYALKDHLGNARLWFSDINNNGTVAVSGEILQHADYYPFGLQHAGLTQPQVGTANGYRYNSKEWNPDLLLKLYDYGARWYDPQLGRWGGVDPLGDVQENLGYSPYVSAWNNPINVFDPDGRSGEFVIDKKNNIITVTSNIIFYGAKGSSKLATKTASNIQSQWNDANGKVTIDDKEYSVRFVVRGTYENSISIDDIKNNNDIKNNYIKLSKSKITVSYMDGAGSNTGEFLINNLNNTSSTTETHEFGHGYGLMHPIDLDLRGKGQPGIMYPRGTAVDAEYTYDPSKGDTEGTPGINAINTLNPVFRKVSQQDINNLGLDKIEYDSKYGVGKLGKLTNIAH